MKKALPFAAAFLMGALALFVLGRILSAFGEWRTIQVIKTENRGHTAELRRLYGYVDVNFEIHLDGRKIYHSPDFAPAYDRPFREWITWDEGRKNVVFMAADQILFAYNLDDHASVPTKEFPSLVIPRYSLFDLGYEGEYPEKNANKSRHGNRH
jgi:hypothetical protein